MTLAPYGMLSITLLLLAPAVPAQGIARVNIDPHGRGSTTTWLHPRPQGNTIQALHFVDARTGWAVGDFGTILHTTDGGKTWRAQDSRTSASLTSCAFAERTRGWIASSRALLRTTDGGASWTSRHGPPLESPRDEYRGVASPAPHRVLTATRLGGIFLSTDDGETWTAVHRSYEPSRLFFLDASHGWVAGAQGRLARTTDGGGTWTDQYVVVPDRAPLQDPSVLYFSDSLRGWIAAGSDLYTTVDGGKRWALLPDSTPRTALAMTAAASLWSCGNGLARSSDGGRSWQAHPGVPRVPLTAITFFGSDAGWAAGAAGIMLHSTDGGDSWRGEVPDTSRAYQCVHVVSRDTVWVLGNGMRRSRDGGITWTTFPAVDGATFQDAHFLDQRHGICVGSRGTVSRTTDAGRTWERSSLGARHELQDVCFSDPTHGWIAARSGALFHSTDGGRHWSLRGDTLPAGLRRIGFPDTARGYAMGRDQGFWTSTDGGRHWSSRTFGRPLLDLAVPDSRRIVVLAREESPNTGSSALVLRSDDGGQTWRAVTIDGAAEPVALHFIDARRGFLLAAAGAVWTTEDGGVSWDAVTAATGVRGRAIGAISPDRAYVAGDVGGIIRIDIQAPN